MGANKPSNTVLVVEDRLDMRIFLRTLLETHGYQPVLASDGRQGLALAREVRPAVIVLDVMMPHEGGAIMYRSLKTDPDLDQIPVIMLSAVARRTFRHYLRMLNSARDRPLPAPDAYIEKPPSPQQLLHALQDCC